MDERVEIADGGGFEAPRDRRPLMVAPPPVLLETVEDARLVMAAGVERELDAFYVGLLEFERDGKAEGVVYRAENFRVIFEVVEPPIQREGMRMLGVVVKSLGDAMRKLREAEIEFERERGLVAGEERVVLTDPAGNWLRITQSKPIM